MQFPKMKKLPPPMDTPMGISFGSFIDIPAAIDLVVDHICEGLDRHEHVYIRAFSNTITIERVEPELEDAYGLGHLFKISVLMDDGIGSFAFHTIDAMLAHALRLTLSKLAATILLRDYKIEEMSADDTQGESDDEDYLRG